MVPSPGLRDAPHADRLARAPRFVPALVGVSAAASLVVGIVWAAPILIRLAA